jgi:putative AlgH/UPF0301 family transcriptional regulator
MKKQDPKEYLNSHYTIDSTTGCWMWNGSVNRKTGFGIFKCVEISKSTMNAQRASWLIHKGPVESKRIFVLQNCANQLCINPDHLFLGSTKESMKIANNRIR